MANLKNIIIDGDTYNGVKQISVQDADASSRDLFLSEGFIEDSTQAQDITANGQQTLVPSTGFDATKQIVVNVNVPSSVGGDATAGDIRKDKTAWVNGVEVTGAIETYDGMVEDVVVVYTDCLTFTGETSEFTLAVGSYGAKEWDGTLYYSTDHNTWNVWDGTAISSANKKLYLKGKGNTKFWTSKGAHLSLSAKAGCSGNIQTLLDWESPPTSISATYCYISMFAGCTNLTTAPNLPATTLAQSCYQSMFINCTSLTTAPALPATTLAKQCYSYMFDGCTNLTTAPALPATTLAMGCYFYMFNGCIKLKLSTTQTTEYETAWRIPSSGTISSESSDWNTGMLTSTGGTFTGDPSINTTYYGAW